MMRMQGNLVGILALLLATTISGCPSNGKEISLVVRARPYPRPRCGRGVASLGHLDLRGKAVDGANVKILSTGQRGKTDTRGQVTFQIAFRNLRAQPRFAQIHAKGFRIQPRYRLLPHKANTAPQVITLQPCLTLGKARRAVGFSTRLTLRPKNLCGKTWEPSQIKSWRWRLLEAAGAKKITRASVQSWTDATLTFRTPPLKALRSIPKSPQILSFSPEQAGEYIFELEAENKQGEISRSQQLITATSVANGMTSVPPFATYVFAGEAKGPWKWKLTRIPKGWRVPLRGATTRTPSVTPIPQVAFGRPEVVELTNELTGLRFSIVCGNWDTVRRDCGRSDCHRSLETAWRQTTHAQTWKRLLDGELKLKRGPAATACADCHALGYNTSFNNGGYDDLARRHGVVMPLKRVKGTYDKLPQAVKDVSNVYCLGCHGPGRLDPPIAEQPGLFGVGICARCHDQPPEHTLVAEWRLAKHAKTITDDINGPDKEHRCAACHTAQGFVYGHFAVARPHASKTAVLNCCETTQPITCQACHDPMRATPRKQVRHFGEVKTPSGAALEMAGSGAICSLCHHADADIENPKHLAERRAPHAPQTDLLVGRAGYLLAPKNTTLPELTGKACVTKTKDSCVTCHMYAGPKAGERGHLALGDHTFLVATPREKGAPASSVIENIASCRPCHATMKQFNDPAKADYDGDGQVEGAKDEVKGLLSILNAKLRHGIALKGYESCSAAPKPGVWIARGAREKIVVVDAKGHDLGDCDKNGIIERNEKPFVFPDTDILLHKAAYNDLVVARDGSFGLHNYGYTIKLLQRTIVALGGETPKWTLRR
ncbi:MAG: hypothetical protein KAI47_01595 [Deltaproteobacteria bacterium]|nr:hypothetical protein [Deltaproteobacteria bacterium]